MEELNKHCWRCDKYHPISEFARNGSDSVCKKCRYELNADWAKNNRDKLRPKRAVYMRLYRARKSKESKENVALSIPAEPEPKVK